MRIGMRLDLGYGNAFVGEVHDVGFTTAWRLDINMRRDAAFAGDPADVSGGVVEESGYVGRPFGRGDFGGDRVVKLLGRFGFDAFSGLLRFLKVLDRCSELIAGFIGRHVGSVAYRGCHA